MMIIQLFKFLHKGILVKSYKITKDNELDTSKI